MKEYVTTSLGRRICFWDSGGDGDVILFIHGNSSSKNTFQHQFESPVLEQYRKVAIDLPGHGSSEWASDYNQEIYFGALASVIAKLGLSEVVVVGHAAAREAAGNPQGAATASELDRVLQRRPHRAGLRELGAHVLSHRLPHS
jgi:pimeloyl-ACP methyl ester carboxylesterase